MYIMRHMDDPEAEKLKRQAKQWVKVNKKKLISQFCDEDSHPATEKPMTIFMAGTPGAGKTEFSISLIETFSDSFVRIDADDIREMMREIGYNGANAELFQEATNKAVNILFDYANKKSGQNVLLDGTFAYGNWRENVERSLAHERIVEIYYLYQDPLIAWDYVKKREHNQGRVVPADVFVKSYELSIKNVQRAIEDFGDQLTVYFAKNDYTKTIESVSVDVDNVANLLPKLYNIEELKGLIDARETD